MKGKKMMTSTPLLIVEEEKIKRNIRQMQHLCNVHHIELRPMVKTHKCAEIIRMQLDAGAKGVLAGSIREALLALSVGCKDITLAYPLTDSMQYSALREISEKARLRVTVDHTFHVEFYAKCFKGMNPVEVLIKIDSGLHRLGIMPEDEKELERVCKSIMGQSALVFAGISTHAGHVYACTSFAEVSKVAKNEQEAIKKACSVLMKWSPVQTIATGSTPTVMASEGFEGITEIRPGNYVFFDMIQVGLKVADIEQCALKVKSSVLSRSSNGHYIIDAGSKQLGLDRGAHGQTLIQDYGRIMEHPSAVVAALSEELGRVIMPLGCSLSIGEMIHIIPNHACTVAHLFRRIAVAGHHDEIKEYWPIESGT